MWHPYGLLDTRAPDARGKVGFVPAGLARPVHTRRMSRRRAAVLALSACLLAAACSDDPEPTATSGTRQSPPPAAVSSPSAAAPAATAATGEPAPPFAADTGRDVEQPSGGPLTVTAVRVARQDGYDRVVFELAGKQAGEPGWRVEYVDRPTRDGSGEPVEVEGDATLVVRIDGAGYPDDTGQQEAQSASVPSDVEVVREVELGAVFEGVYEAFVGTSGKQPFRVFRLADPARVVVDVRHG